MKATGIITRFGLIRHAETQWNREKRIQGQTDSPLTRRGILQAGKWGRILNQISWNRILTSDIGRAVETACRINEKLKISIMSDRRLREQDWGRWTGKTMIEIEKDDAQLFADQIRAGWMFCPPEGETRLNMWERSHRALGDAAATWPGEAILIVTHEGVIKSLIYRLGGRKLMGNEPPLLKFPHLHWLVHNQQCLQLQTINAMRL